MTANDPGYVFKQITRAITNLDRRLRIVENRETGGGGGGTTPPEPTTPVTPTLPGGWNVVAPYQIVGFWKDSSNAVHLQGTASLPSGVTFPVTLFTLPADFRPLAQLSFSVPTYGVIDVLSSGEVRVREAVGFVSLDGISFLAG
jgi:hypothetical protein